MFIWWLVLAASGAAPSGASRLIYRAAEGCPPRSAFEAAVRVRLPEVRFDPRAARFVDVRIQTSSAAFQGRLTAGEGGNVFAPRRVEAASCEEVVSALGLIAALVLESPRWELPPPRPPPVLEINPPYQATYVAHVTAASVARSPSRAWELAAVGRLEVESGGLPNPEVGRSIGVWAGGLRPGSAPVHARLTGVWTGGHVGADLARMSRRSLALEVCGEVASVGSVRFDACGRGTVGVLDARGEELLAAAEAQRPWGSVGVAARTSWFFLPRTFLHAGIHAELPLVRDRFRARPDALLYRPAPVLGGVQFGAGVVFW